MAFKQTTFTGTVTEKAFADYSPSEAFNARCRVIKACGLEFDADAENLRIEYRDHSGDLITVKYEGAA